ncbi:MAG: 50S ribosomal protein L17 [Tannerella sp.]|jgi:large subunit ribosomal protein L17|nr:50S ribosomal protein L17 [Tannerella sp.]
MRHNKKINHLSRTHSHRIAMLSNMASSLILHKRIFTTTAKAKALRKYVEPLITKSKEQSRTSEQMMHQRRVVFAELQNKYAVTELFKVVAEKIGDRPGGYTRIIKTGNRLGDNAAMCFIELVDFNENMLKETKKAAKTRRSRRGGGKKAEAETTTAATPALEKKPKAKAVEEVVETVTEAPETAVDEPVEAVAETVEAVETPVAEPVAEEAVEAVAEVVAEEATPAADTPAEAEAAEEEKKD